MKKKKLRYLFLSFALILICVLVYSFLWGKLFPYSPLYPGFAKHELNNTIIYVQEGANFSEFNRIDTLTKPVEVFHELKFKNKPKIFIFRDDASYKQRSISKARFCAFTSGALIISPWALKEDKKGIISLEIYVKHELSHILIYSYKGVIGGLRYPRWLLEGIAMRSVNQMGTSFYPSKEQTYKLIRDGNFMPPEYYNTSREDDVKLNVKHRIAFIYSELGCIVDCLIESYGKEKFIQYMKLLIDENDNYAAFRKVYQMEFLSFLSYFRHSAGE